MGIADRDITADDIKIELLLRRIGITDRDCLDGLYRQLARLSSSDGTIDKRELNSMLAMIVDLQPRDLAESLLAVQMIAVHVTMMTAGARLAKAQAMFELDSAGRVFTRSARTFAAQLETLKRYRTGGEQRVTVQHMTVGEGGQAIVGHVTRPPADAARENTRATAALLSDAKVVPMELIESPAKVLLAGKRRAR